MFISSCGKVFNFPFTFHFIKKVDLELGAFLNGLLYVLDPVRPPAAPPWFFFAIQRCAPAVTWQVLSCWNGVVNTKMSWALRQKHHSGTEVPSTTFLHQGIPSRFVARNWHKACLGESSPRRLWCGQWESDLPLSLTRFRLQQSDKRQPRMLH